MIEDIRCKYDPLVVFAFAETSVIPASYIRDRLSARGNNFATAQKCRNKYLMREALKKFEICIPKFCLVSGTDDLDIIKRKVGNYPLICKPVLGFSSQGVRRVENDKELTEAIKVIKRENKYVMHKYYQMGNSDYLDKVQIESFLYGKEVCVDGIVIEHKPHILLNIDKPDVSNSPYLGDSVHIAPARLSATEQINLKFAVEQVIVAVGIANGPFHLEARIQDENVYVIELGARIGFPRLLRQSLQLDIVTLAQQVMLGENCLPEF